MFSARIGSLCARVSFSFFFVATFDSRTFHDRKTAKALATINDKQPNNSYKYSILLFAFLLFGIVSLTLPFPSVIFNFYYCIMILHVSVSYSARILRSTENDALQRSATGCDAMQYKPTNNVDSIPISSFSSVNLDRIM